MKILCLSHYLCINLLRVIALWAYPCENLFEFACADQAPGSIVRSMPFHIVANQLADDLRGRHVLCGAEFLERLFLHGVYQQGQSGSFIFHCFFVN